MDGGRADLSNGPRVKLGEEEERWGQEKLWHLLPGEQWARKERLNC